MELIRSMKFYVTTLEEKKAKEKEEEEKEKEKPACMASRRIAHAPAKHGHAGGTGGPVPGELEPAYPPPSHSSQQLREMEERSACWSYTSGHTANTRARARARARAHTHTHTHAHAHVRTPHATGATTGGHSWSARRVNGDGVAPTTPSPLTRPMGTPMEPFQNTPLPGRGHRSERCGAMYPPAPQGAPSTGGWEYEWYWEPYPYPYPHRHSALSPLCAAPTI